MLLQHAAPQAQSSITPSVVANRLLHDPQANVKMYYLLDRYVDGCRAPMIVVDRLPQAEQAIGRVIGPR